jgi:nucleoside-diphosphate-sugar epimerase
MMKILVTGGAGHVESTLVLYCSLVEIGGEC